MEAIPRGLVSREQMKMIPGIKCVRTNILPANSSGNYSWSASSDAFDFARGCGGFTTRHGIARRSRTPYGIDASESPWVVRLLTAPHVLSRVAGGPAQVLGYSVGCYRNAHKMFGSFEDLVTDLSVYLFCMQDDLSCPPSRQLSGFFDDRRL